MTGILHLEMVKSNVERRLVSAQDGQILVKNSLMRKGAWGVIMTICYPK